MNPSWKSKEMEGYIDNMTQEWFGRKRTDSIQGNTCVSCGEPAMDFRDPLSMKEYTISGLCQKCQDSIFGVDDEDHY